MTISVGRGSLLAVLVLLACGGRAPTGPRRIVIRDVTIISPGTARVDHGAVAIVGERIAAAGARVDPEPGDSVITGSGRYLAPGLIDGHVHLAEAAGVPFPTPAELTTAVDQYFEQLPRSYLYHGFTTLVDLNVVDRAILDRFKSAPQHPDLYDCGGGLPVRDGYPMGMAPAPARYGLFPNYLIDPADRARRLTRWGIRRKRPCAAWLRAEGSASRPFSRTDSATPTTGPRRRPR